MKTIILRLCIIIIMANVIVFADTGSGASDSGFLTSLPPAPPNLKQPFNSQQSVQAPVNFLWDRLLHAASYNIQVSLSDSLDDPIVNQDALSDTFYTLTDLDRNSKYYWHVCAVNVAGTGNFSPTWDFTTIGDEPGIPELSSPENAAQGISISTDLKWNSVPGAETYTLQVSTLPDFSSLTIEKAETNDTLCTAENLVINTLYFWRVNAKNSVGTSAWSSVWMFTTGATSVDNSKTGQLPENFALLPIYPNPFNGSTSITFELPRAANVSIIIYNSIGQVFYKAAAGYYPAGRHTIHWNGYSSSGESATSGQYICRFQAQNHIMIQKMLLVR